MSTVEKETDEKKVVANSGCCGAENKDAAALATKVEVAKQQEAVKEKESGNCGCG